MLRDSEDGIPTLSPQITAEALLALDARFGWLNDYIAFRQDFGHDATLQHELASRAYGNIQMARTLVVKPQSWLAAIFSNGGVRVFAVMILIKLAGWLFDLVKGTPYETTVTTLTVICADVALMAWIFTAQRRLRPKHIAAKIAIWFGLFLPLLLLPLRAYDGSSDYTLLWMWIVPTLTVSLFVWLTPAWRRLMRHFEAKARSR